VHNQHNRCCNSTDEWWGNNKLVNLAHGLYICKYPRRYEIKSPTVYDAECFFFFDG
jgi:hypothetical protein